MLVEVPGQRDIAVGVEEARQEADLRFGAVLVGAARLAAGDRTGALAGVAEAVLAGGAALDQHLAADLAQRLIARRTLADVAVHRPQIGLAGGGVDLAGEGAHDLGDALFDDRPVVAVGGLGGEVQDDHLGGMLLQEVLHPGEHLVEGQQVVIVVLRPYGAGRGNLAVAQP